MRSQISLNLCVLKDECLKTKKSSKKQSVLTVYFQIIFDEIKNKRTSFYDSGTFNSASVFTFDSFRNNHKMLTVVSLLYWGPEFPLDSDS